LSNRHITVSKLGDYNANKPRFRQVICI